MGITKKTSGKFLGYTLGRDKPTLYFENGRYTQVYPTDARNVGWHPNTPHYRGMNITREAHDLIVSPLTKAERVKLIDRFLTGEFDSDAVDAKFFECKSLDGKSWTPHASSSRLIKTDDPSFDDTYNDAYAESVLDKGDLAPNEN